MRRINVQSVQPDSTVNGSVNGSKMGQKWVRKNETFKKVAKNPPISEKSAGFLVRPEGFEPPAFWSVARRSIQLS